MNWQVLATTLLVVSCGSYALWNLMPRAWRGRVALWCGRPAMAASSGCGGCDGCGGKPAATSSGQSPAQPGEVPVHVVRFVKPRG